jgi:hypothetical protein
MFRLSADRRRVVPARALLALVAFAWAISAGAPFTVTDLGTRRSG